MIEVLMFTPGFVSRGRLPVLGGTLVLRHNDVSTFQLDVDGNDHKWARFKHGYRIVITDGGVQLLSGWVTGVNPKRSAGVADVSINGVSDAQWLKQRITLPDPSSGLDAQSAASYWKRRAPAETVLRDLVRLNAGPDAIASRRAPLIVEPDQARGGTVSANTRFKPVLDELRSLSGGLSFDLVQDIPTRQSVFRVREGRDLRKAVNLTESNGGLPSWELSQEAPEVTHVLVAGQGEGSARNLKLVPGNVNDWNVYAEVFKDRRDTDSADDLTQAGQESLEEGQEKASVSLEVVEVPTKRFGERFLLGDRITATLNNGQQVSDVLQQAELTYAENGRTVKLQIGPVPTDDDAPRWVKEARRLNKRISTLETR